LQHENVNSKDFISSVTKYECDLFVSMSFNQIFKSQIINLPRLKTINCHAGNLPFYRGRNVINWALINDEVTFGITVHYVDTGVDTGDIILQKQFPINDNDDYSTLLSLAYVECANILYDAILLLKQNLASPTKQKDIHPIGFYCSQRKKGDELLAWNQNSRDIFNFIRALCEPGPRARSFINGKEIKINKAEYIYDAPNYKGIVGSVIQKDSGGFLVKTKDSFIRIIDFEYKGSLKVGDRFET